VAAAEIGIRVWDLADPGIRTMPLPGEYQGLFRPDEELFWSLSPNLRLRFQGETVVTNAMGFRASQEVGDKLPGEFRILSLGESTTFGPGVANDRTYSAVLERLLQETDDTRSFRVINAGVPAYSSFQSLMYLKRRGLALEPDLVLFYHELNDFLPSSLRDSSNNEIGLSSTDRQLFESRQGQVDRKLLSWSAIYRFLVFRAARYRIARLQQDQVQNPLVDIGLPDIGLPPRVVQADRGQDEQRPTLTGLNEKALPSRVSPEERRQHFDELASLCEENGIQLLLIHPSYAGSKRHECILTEFCSERQVAMLEAYDVLHPDGSGPATMFRDSWHPRLAGHRALAQALSRKISKEFLDRDR